MDAFRIQLGSRAGRRPDGADGHVFVLGAEPGAGTYDLAPGDHVALRQEADLSDVALLEAPVRLWSPTDLPDGWRWVASLRVAGQLRAALHGRRHDAREGVLAANVSDLVGVALVELRLELVAL